MEQWYVAVSGKQMGPWSTEEILRKIRSGDLDRTAHVYLPGMAGWEPIGGRHEFAAAIRSKRMTDSPPPMPTRASIADEIDYEIFGEEMQFVELTLDPNEACVAEAGSFMYMDHGINMETIFGDGSPQSGSVLGMLAQAGKRVLTGESLFMTVFSNQSGGKQKVAFASPYPGRIVPLDLAQLGGSMICQKDSFLVAAKGISVGIAFQKKLGAGFFGGEGFILQKLEGDGLAFVHAGGMIVERHLGPGEVLRLDTGCLVAFEPRVDYDIQFVSGIKTALFGGEGLFHATLRGPGKIWMQSLPFSRFASRVFAAAPRSKTRGGGSDRGEGSILGLIGDLAGGDRS